MRTVELVEGIKSSVLGFGCAPMLGAIDSKTAQKALEIAYEHGITHFDLARSYGYGQAESLVGKLMHTKRDKIIITSKFGIEANWIAALLRPVKPLVRMIKKEQNLLLPAQSATGLFHSHVKINTKVMHKSLEKSLKALRTDYLDYFMIHEPHQSVQNIDELCELAMRLKQQGKIRAWGLAFMESQRPLHQSYLNRFDLLQFSHFPFGEGEQKTIKTRGQMPNVLFSALKGGDHNKSPREKLRKLFADFPRSVILCSMFTERHLKENIENSL